MIVSAKLFSFEELNSCLVQLQNYDFVQEVETVDISVSFLNTLRELGDFVDRSLFRSEK